MGPPPRPRRLLPIVVLALAGAAAFPTGAGNRAEPASAPAPAPAPRPTRVPAAAPPTTPIPPGFPPAPAVPDAARPPAPTPGPPPPAPPPLALPPAPAASRLAAIVERGLADPRLAGTRVGLSVFVDGLGEIAVRNPDLALHPASNQKLFTAMAALAALEPEGSFTTEARAAGTVTGATLDGDLVLVGGGDPTLRSAGPHSLDALARQVAGRGLAHVRGALVGDESRYDDVRTAPGWFPWHVPGIIGPLSALTVDANRHRRDPAFVAAPVAGNLALFRAALARHGVGVDGPDRAGTPAAGDRPLARLVSAPYPRIVGDMLLRSDNTAAELLVKEIGLRLRGRGTTRDGLDAAAQTLRSLEVPLRGTSGDGSGLSRADLRSAREWRRLLGAARTAPWGARFVASLPVAGRTGTLARRFAGTAAEGRLRAKTGRIVEGRALSGYLTTAGGREVVFSVVVNSETAAPASVAAAIDAMLAALAAERA